MTLSAMQPALFTVSFLAQLGINDLSKLVAQTYVSDPQINGRGITYREQTTLYVDDTEAQLRLVVRLCIESKKRGKKRIPVPNSFPSVRVSRLSGYDPVKHMWGGAGHSTEDLDDPELDEAWQAHLELETLRSTMKQHGPYNWYATA